MEANTHTEAENEMARYDRMVRVLWNLTPRELARLMDRNGARLTENMKVAIGMRVSEADRFTYDNRDVQTYRGNAFVDWMRDNPVCGPKPQPVAVNSGYDDCPF